MKRSGFCRPSGACVVLDRYRGLTPPGYFRAGPPGLQKMEAILSGEPAIKGSGAFWVSEGGGAEEILKSERGGNKSVTRRAEGCGYENHIVSTVGAGIVVRLYAD